MIIRYVQVLKGHAVNLFSLASLVIGLLAAFFFQFGGVINAIIITGAAFTSILVAGYFAWKEVIDQLPKSGNLSIAFESMSLTTTTIDDSMFDYADSRGLLSMSLTFEIGLDAINRGDESIVLRALKVTKFETNTDFWGMIPDGDSVYLPDSEETNRFSLPFTVREKSRLRLVCAVPAIFAVRERLEFARRLVEMKDVNIEISYTFDDMERVSHSQTITLHRSLTSYVEEKIQAWTDSKEDHDLAIAALKEKVAINSS